MVVCGSDVEMGVNAQFQRSMSVVPAAFEIEDTSTSGASNSYMERLTEVCQYVV